MAFGQRVTKPHILGKSIGVGTVPLITSSLSTFCPGFGIERSSFWVYGCIGELNNCFVVVCSTTCPRYITYTRSTVSAITAMLCVI